MSIDKFFEVYEKHLTAVIADADNQFDGTNNPGGYCYSLDRVPGVVIKMKASVAGSIAGGKTLFNKDGKGFRRTCTELKIPYTYAGILAFCSRPPINVIPIAEGAYPTQLNVLTEDERSALLDYIKWAVDDEPKKSWKDMLLTDWYHAGEKTGWPDGRRGCGRWRFLQRIRNDFGPRWLDTVPEDMVRELAVAHVGA